MSWQIARGIIIVHGGGLPMPHRWDIIKLLPKWLQNFKWLHAIGPKIRERSFIHAEKNEKQAAEENYSLKLLTVNFLLLPLHDDKVFWQRRKKTLLVFGIIYRNIN